MFLKIQAAMSLFTCTCMLGATTIPAGPIGTATANGEMQVDGSTIRSNSTLFDGSTVQTTGVRSDVRLSDGSQVVLNPNSRMTLYRDHAVLEQGLTMQRNVGKHAVIANGLRVTSETPSGVVLVGVQDKTHMEVMSRSGVADVQTPAGDLVARIEPGKTLSFNTAPVENASTSSIKIAGILRPVAGHFVLTDTQSGLMFQLRGTNLAALSGTPVQVIGMVASAAPTVPGASRMVDVSDASPQNSNSGTAQPAQAGFPAVLSDHSSFWNSAGFPVLMFVVGDGIFFGLALAGTFSSRPSVSLP